MIIIRVAEIMGKHKLNQTKLAELTGIRKNTISNLWHGRVKRIEMDQLDQLCKALQCTPGEILEYVPDPEG